MKKILTVILALAIVLTFAGCTASSRDLPSVITLDENAVKQHSLTVSARGIVTVMPDVAYINVGVTTQNTDMQKAQEENASVMSAMFEALKNAGLTDDDMHTIQYSAYPIYDYRDQKQVITNYEVTNLIELKIKDINRVGEYIDIASDNGANITNSISFGILDEQSCYNEALKVAVETAKAKADAMAAAGGVKIIGTLSINENSYGGEVYREYAAEEELADTAATPISTGDLEISANVTVTYDIE